MITQKQNRVGNRSKEKRRERRMWSKAKGSHHGGGVGGVVGRNASGRLAIAEVIVRGMASYTSSSPLLSSSSSSTATATASASSNQKNIVEIDNDSEIGKPVNLFSAINQALHIALDSDPRFVILSFSLLLLGIRD